MCFLSFLMCLLSLTILYWGIGSGKPMATVEGILIGATGLLFFGFSLAALAARLFDRRPAIVLDVRGITDQASATSMGFVPWEEVAGVRLTESAGRKFIAVDLVDPMRVLKEAPIGPVGRLFARHNLRRYGTPLFLGGAILTEDLPEVFGAIVDFGRRTEQ